jgi:death-on-curing family protein
MSRVKRTVHFLSTQASLPEDFALELLNDSGIKVTRPQDVIKKKYYVKALIALNLIKPPKPKPVKVEKISPPKSVGKKTEDNLFNHKIRTQIEEPTKATIKARRTDIPIIGNRQPLSYLSYNEVEKIHWFLVEDFIKSRDPIDPPGIRDTHLLNSALTRCQTSLGRDLKYPTAPMAAGALVHSLIHNHPFFNGNKRTGLVSMLVFLDKNGWNLRMEEDILYDFMLNIGGHNLPINTSLNTADAEVYEIAQTLHYRMNRINHRMRRLKFHDLRAILSKLDCEFETVTRGCAINIKCNQQKTQIYYGGDGKDVEIKTIQKLRRDLHLDELHGYDPDMFYDAEERLPSFIAKYRKTLARLAKV